MIKQFCDVCTKEIGRNYVSDLYRPRLKQIQCNVGVTIKGSNKGELCRECLLKCINNGTEDAKKDRDEQNEGGRGEGDAGVPVDIYKNPADKSSTETPVNIGNSEIISS